MRQMYSIECIECMLYIQAKKPITLYPLKFYIIEHKCNNIFKATGCTLVPKPFHYRDILSSGNNLKFYYFT